MSGKFNFQGRKARKLGKVNGKMVHRFPVSVTDGHRAALLQDADGYARGSLEVIAYSASDAADYVRGLTAGMPCIEIEVWGVRGGLAAHRYAGFESAVWQEMCMARPDGVQLGLLDDQSVKRSSQSAIRVWNEQLREQLRPARK